MGGGWGSAPISIHALLAESDRDMHHALHLDDVFLSTLSLRRATDTVCSARKTIRISIHALLAESDLCLCFDLVHVSGHFYPRSPCGERLQWWILVPVVPLISIHALLAESDEQAKVLKVAAHGISIHALLAESDLYRP